VKFAQVFFPLALAVSLAANPSATAAAEKNLNLDTAKRARATPALDAVQAIHTAHALVRYGDANGDALSLITAARILKQAGSRSASARREGSVAVEKKTRDERFSVNGILARATILANGRADVVALADDVAESGTRGAINGPARWTEVVSSGRTDSYRIAFRGGESAGVAVSGDGDSDLDLYVFDESGNLICKDESGADDMLCRWRPRWNGHFIVKIRNLGVANEYVLVHN